MRCSICGGHVEWKGPITNLTHTECASCGGINCQEPEEQEDQPCSMALCNGTIVYLADGTECCSCTIARFEALYGYRPALQH